jgi:hypothetical protein
VRFSVAKNGPRLRTRDCHRNGHAERIEPQGQAQSRTRADVSDVAQLDGKKLHPIGISARSNADDAALPSRTRSPPTPGSCRRRPPGPRDHEAHVQREGAGLEGAEGAGSKTVLLWAETELWLGAENAVQALSAKAFSPPLWLQRPTQVAGGFDIAGDETGGVEDPIDVGVHVACDLRRAAPTPRRNAAEVRTAVSTATSRRR